MTELVSEWYSSKKLTHHRLWEVQAGYAWVLFILGETLTGTYHTGVSDTAEDAEKEIKWAIATEIKRRGLL